jgi:hypothetical protein
MFKSPWLKASWLKSPWLRKVTFELFPAALLSFTGSIFVAQYIRPTVVVTPPSSELSVRDDLIRAIQQERVIILDQMAQIAAMNAFNAPVRDPANAEATPSFNAQKTSTTAAPPQVRNVQPRPQAKANVASAQQPDDVKKQAPFRIDVSKADASPSISNSPIQPPIAIVPDNVWRADRADHDKRISAFDAVSRPFERTAVWLKALKSKIAGQLSISSAADTPQFPGHGIY